MPDVVQVMLGDMHSLAGLKNAPVFAPEFVLFRVYASWRNEAMLR